MLGTRKKLQIKDGIQMCILGIILGILVVFSAEKYLLPFYAMGEDILRQQDFFNVIFFWDNFTDEIYMSKTSMNFLSVAMFYFLPFSILSVRNYAKSGKDYYGFLAIRSTNMSELLKRVLGKQGIMFLIFTYAYIISVVLCIKVKYPDISCNSLEMNIICLGLLGVIRALTLNLLSHILFWIYLKWDVGVAVFSGYIIMLGALLIDANIKSVNICLFHYENYFVDSMVILGIGNVVACLVERRIKIRV